MMKQVKGKIILVDDEKYEKDFLERSLRKKDWDIKVEYFNNAEDTIKHLRENADEIFLIISDMDMPKMNGMELKKAIDRDEYLRQKTIPFIFATNSMDRDKMIEAYHYRVQGYFQKPMTPKDQAEMLEIIIQYWIACVHPEKDDIRTQANRDKVFPHDTDY
jgi:DNA-binding NtrC family response regulator